MDQMKHQCSECGHEWTNDRCSDACPECGSVGATNVPNVDAPAINDSRPEQRIDAYTGPGAYVDEDVCGGRK